MFGIRTRRPPPFGGIHINDDKDIQVHRPEDASRNSLWAEGRLLFRDLVFALMIAALVVVFIVQPVKVEGTSMLPRLHDGERIFVNKLIYYDEYRWAPKIERGDIVVFWYPDDPSKSYIKRVIGLPGEIVEVREGTVSHKWQLCSRRNISILGVTLHPRSQGPIQVNLNYYFVMGDNRDNSSDSRSWGQVPKSTSTVRRLLRYWPPSAASVIHHEDLAPAPAPPRLPAGPGSTE